MAQTAAPKFVPPKNFNAIFAVESGQAIGRLVKALGRGVPQFPQEILDAYFTRVGTSWTLRKPAGEAEWEAAKAELARVAEEAEGQAKVQQVARQEPLVDAHQQAVEQERLSQADRDSWFRPPRIDDNVGTRRRHAEESIAVSDRVLADMRTPGQVRGDVSRLRREGRMLQALDLLKKGARKFPADEILKRMLENAPDEQQLEQQGARRRAEELLKAGKFEKAAELLKAAYEQNPDDKWLGRMLIRALSEEMRELPSRAMLDELKNAMDAARRNGAMDERAYADALYGYLSFVGGASRNFLGRRSHDAVPKDKVKEAQELFKEAQMLNMAERGAYRAMIGIYKCASWSDAQALLEHEAKDKGYIDWEPVLTLEGIEQRKRWRQERREAERTRPEEEKRESAEISIRHMYHGVMNNTLEAGWFGLAHMVLASCLENKETPAELKKMAREALPKLEEMLEHVEEYKAKERAELIQRYKDILTGKERASGFEEIEVKQELKRAEEKGDVEIAELARKVQAHIKEREEQQKKEYEQRQKDKEAREKAEFKEKCERIISGVEEADHSFKWDLENKANRTTMDELLGRPVDDEEIQLAKRALAAIQERKEEAMRMEMLNECELVIEGAEMDQWKRSRVLARIHDRLPRYREKGDLAMVEVMEKAQEMLERENAEKARNADIEQYRRKLEGREEHSWLGEERYYDWEYNPLRGDLKRYEAAGDAEVVDLLRQLIAKMEASKEGPKLIEAYQKHVDEVEAHERKVADLKRKDADREAFEKGAPMGKKRQRRIERATKAREEMNRSIFGDVMGSGGGGHDGIF